MNTRVNKKIKVRIKFQQGKYHRIRLVEKSPILVSYCRRSKYLAIRNGRVAKLKVLAVLK